MKRKKQNSKQSDFPRKKRKLGKGKRPPENATAVSFKSRSIVVPTQLEQTQQPTGKRKLSLQALLNHLSHFKASMRRDGLHGLRDLFQEHPNLLIPNLAKIVPIIFSKTIDQDVSVRHALHSLVSFVFPQVPADHIATFLPTIIIHVSCGLTHINDRTQIDSLKLFGLLLRHYPHALPPHSSSLLPLLLSLISRHETSSSSGKRAIKGNKTTSSSSSSSFSSASLASNPSSKLSRAASRVEIFSLLKHYLLAIEESLLGCEDKGGSQLPASHVYSSAPLVDLTSRELVVESGGKVISVRSNLCDLSGAVPHVMVLRSVGIPCTSVNHPQSISTCLASSTLSRAATSVGGEQILSGSEFLEFAERLISILNECWVECAPSQLLAPQSSSLIILGDTLTLMELIIDILSLVLKISSKIQLTTSTSTYSSASITASPITQSPKVSSSVSSTSMTSLNTASFTHTEPHATPTMLQILSSKVAPGFLKHFMTYFPLFESPTNPESSYIVTNNTTTTTNSSATKKEGKSAKTERSSRSTKSIGAAHCNIALSLNLTLCHIISLLSSLEGDQMSKPLQSASAFYATLPQKRRLIKSSSQSSLSWAKLVSESLSPLLSSLQRRDMEEGERRVLRGVWGVYDACHVQSSSKKRLMECLRDLRKNCSTESLLYTTLLHPWLCSLPALLVELAGDCPDTSAMAIDCLVAAGPVVNVEEDASVLTSLNALQPVVSKLPPASQRRFVELFWTLPLTALSASFSSSSSSATSSSSVTPSSSSFTLTSSSSSSPSSSTPSSFSSTPSSSSSSLAQWIHSGALTPSVVSYLIETVHHKFIGVEHDFTSNYHKSSSSSTSSSTTSSSTSTISTTTTISSSSSSSPNSLVSKVTMYLSFMMKILLGEDVDVGTEYESRVGTEYESRVGTEYESRVGTEYESRVGTLGCSDAVWMLKDCKNDLELKMKITETVCFCLKSADFSNHTLEIITPTLLDVVEGMQSPTITIVTAILHLVESLAEKQLPPPLLPPLARLCLSVLLTKEGGTVTPVAMVMALNPVVGLLKLYRPLMKSLLELFSATIESLPSTSPLHRGCITTFISLLSSTELNISLRALAPTLRITANTIITHLTAEEGDLKVKLKLSVTKFSTV